jgi:DNA repair protein RecO (recombination protein O)
LALVRSRVLVLQTFAYGDTSKILRLYTLEFGLRSVIAKGAQRAKSRYGGLLEPFTEGDAQFYLKEGRELHTLGGFDLLRARQALGRDLAAFASASLLAELVLRFGTEEPQPELFAEVTGALDRLASAPPGRTSAVAISSLWRIISLLGYHPELESCVGCGSPFDPAEPTRFDVLAGGAACTTCRSGGRMVDPATRAQVAEMSRGGTGEVVLSDSSLHRALARAFLGAHLASEHPLRSLDLFLDTVGVQPLP